jgi:hypothetical protein
MKRSTIQEKTGSRTCFHRDVIINDKTYEKKRGGKQMDEIYLLKRKRVKIYFYGIQIRHNKRKQVICEDSKFCLKKIILKFAVLKKPETFPQLRS